MIGSKRRWREGRPAALVAMQSFTLVFMGSARPWHAGVLYNRDARFSDALIAWLNGEEGLIVGDNKPYSVTDKSDYTISVPSERGLLHVEVEIRQDLIAGDNGQRAWGRCSRFCYSTYIKRLVEQSGQRWAMTRSADLPRNGSRHWLGLVRNARHAHIFRRVGCHLGNLDSEEARQ